MEETHIEIIKNYTEILSTRVIQKILSKLNREEELEYWKVQSRKLHQEQKKVIRKAKTKV